MVTNLGPNQPSEAMNSTQPGANSEFSLSPQPQSSPPEDSQGRVILQAFIIGILGAILCGTLIAYNKMSDSYLCSGLGGVACLFVAVPLVVFGFVMYCAVAPYTMKRFGLPNYESIIFTVLTSVLAFWVVLAGFVWHGFANSIYIAVSVLGIAFMASFLAINYLYNDRKISNQKKTLLLAFFVITFIFGIGYKVYLYDVGFRREVSDRRLAEQNKPYEDAKKIDFSVHIPADETEQTNVIKADFGFYGPGVLHYTYKTSKGTMTFFELAYKGNPAESPACPDIQILKNNICTDVTTLQSGEMISKSTSKPGAYYQNSSYFVLKGGTFIRIDPYTGMSESEVVDVLDSMRTLDQAELPKLLGAK